MHDILHPVMRSVMGPVVGAAATDVVGQITITQGPDVGDQLTIQVTDADLNTDSGTQQQTTATVVNQRTNESESVTLTETGNDTGIFSGTLNTNASNDAGTDDDGTMNARPGDTLEATYVDAAPSANRTAQTTFTSTAGSVAFTDDTPDPGDTLTITVTDADLNLDSGTAETVDVTVVNGTTNESEAVTLTETGVDTGIFTGTLDTARNSAAGTDDDGTMNVAPDDVLTVTYVDASPSANRTDTATVQAVAGTVAFTDDAPEPGDTLTITVTDADLNTNPASAQTVDVDVVNGTTSESETVTLTETGNDTGVFTGTLTTTDAAGAGTDDDGDMNVQDTDVLTVTYVDASPSGNRTDTATVTAAAATPIIQLTINTNLIAGTEILMPLAGTVNCNIAWGDGLDDDYTTSGNKSHTYASNGIYQITITGTLTDYGAFALSTNPAIVSLDQWNDGLTGLFSAFYGATNLTDVPNNLPSTVTSCSRCFQNCSSLDDGDIASWNVTAVTNFSNFLTGATLSTANYDALLIGWEGQAVQNSVSFHGGNSTYTSGGAAETARTALINDHSWTITDGGSA